MAILSFFSNKPGEKLLEGEDGEKLDHRVAAHSPEPFGKHDFKYSLHPFRLVAYAAVPPERDSGTIGLV